MILEVMNKGLEKTFSREKNIGTIIRDGMDIGLCVINRKRKKLQYAGAFLPLYLIREGNLVEISADKIIIGMNPEGLSYLDHEINLLDDDIFYIFLMVMWISLVDLKIKNSCTGVSGTF